VSDKIRAIDHPRTGSARTIIALAALTLVAFGLRYYGSWIRFFWYDELAVHVYALNGHPSSQEPPLFSWLEFFWIWLTQSDTPATMRLLPVALGALAVPVTYRFARHFGSRNCAMLAALLVAVAPKALHLSHEIRPYSLFILMSAMLLGALFSAYEKDTWPYWLVYRVCLMLCLLTHMLALQLCLAMGLTAVL